MKIQACMFRRTLKKYKSNVPPPPGAVGDWESGIAVVDGFNSGSVSYIIDSKGDKLKLEPYDWRLNGGPMQYMDTEYAG